MAPEGRSHCSWTCSDPGRPQGAGPLSFAPILSRLGQAGLTPPQQALPGQTRGQSSGQRTHCECGQSLDTGTHRECGQSLVMFSLRTLKPREHKLLLRSLSLVEPGLAGGQGCPGGRVFFSSAGWCFVQRTDVQRCRPGTGPGARGTGITPDCTPPLSAHRCPASSGSEGKACAAPAAS